MRTDERRLIAGIILFGVLLASTTMFIPKMKDPKISKQEYEMIVKRLKNTKDMSKEVKMNLEMKKSAYEKWMKR